MFYVQNSLLTVAHSIYRIGMLYLLKWQYYFLLL